jgi:cytochrome P450
VFIPKDRIVAFSIYALHRRPDLYGMDAELFRPERWNEDMPMRRGKTTEKWGYLPFNGGPRICLGSERYAHQIQEMTLTELLLRDFALTEAAYTLVRILLHFPEMGLPAGQQIEITGVEKQTVTLVLSSSEGCRVKIH